MLIELSREGNIPGQGMFGRLKVGDFECLTVEREWLENKAMVSCIPTGEYQLYKHSWKGTFPTFGLKGGTVSQFPDSNFKRNLILIHPANVSSELHGCIALGSGRGFYKGQYSITNSVKTVKEFLKVLSDSNESEHILRITNQ